MSENAETIIEIFFRRLEITAYVVLFINIGGTDMSLNEDVLSISLYIISYGPFHNIFFRQYCSLYTLYVFQTEYSNIQRITGGRNYLILSYCFFLIN